MVVRLEKATPNRERAAKRAKEDTFGVMRLSHNGILLLPSILSYEERVTDDEVPAPNAPNIAADATTWTASYQPRRPPGAPKVRI